MPDLMTWARLRAAELLGVSTDMTTWPSSGAGGILEGQLAGAGNAGGVGKGDGTGFPGGVGKGGALGGGDGRSQGVLPASRRVLHLSEEPA